MRLSESRQNALQKAKDITQAASGNLLYQKWRQEAIQSFSFYDGEGQYPAEVLAKLKERKQAPITINKVRSMVNQASGLEINTRTKIAYRTHSGKDEEELLTKALTHFAYAVQESENFSYKGSLKFRDGLICGIGWSRMYMHKGRIYYDYTHPLNVIYDADDFSPQLEDMNHLIYMRWMTPDNIKSTWSKHAKQFDKMYPDKDFSSVNSGNFSSEFFNRNNANLPAINGGNEGSRPCVNEVLYKEERKYYWGLDKRGYYFETFDEEVAEKVVNKKSELEEESGLQIMRTVYCGDLLLDYAPLSPNIPNMSDFPDIPFVWGRRTSDSVPTGWLEDMKDLQREINYRKFKELTALNSVRARVDPKAFHGMSIDQIRDELARPDSVLFGTKDGVDIFNNIDLAASNIRASERTDLELQQVSGMYSDSLGAATNATSGIAIKQRQIGTSKNLAFGFDGSTLVKKREGKVLLDLIQKGGLTSILTNLVLDDDEREIFILNAVKEVNGEIVNDIRTLPIDDIYVEQVPDYESSPEEQQATLEALLANPQAPLILQNPELLKLLRFRNADKIAAAMMQTQQQQNIAEAGGAPQIPMDDVGDVNPTQLGAI